ncbi:hypothetical protein [Natrinema soli]|uniref:Uncharacterized protein n=1 Tax=Natrinema soli TaxID=1930624 RepID=A0ABD5SRF5_9EURY|nr:hypothetical protein [Natrinema soli]
MDTQPNEARDIDGVGEDSADECSKDDAADDLFADNDGGGSDGDNTERDVESVGTVVGGGKGAREEIVPSAVEGRHSGLLVNCLGVKSRGFRVDFRSMPQ